MSFHVLATTWEKMTSSPPNQVFSDIAESSARKVDEDRKRKATETAKESRQRSKYSRNENPLAPRNAYSWHDDVIEPDDITNNVSPEYLDEMKNSFYTTRVKLTKEQADDTERDTRGSNLWMREVKAYYCNTSWWHSEDEEEDKEK